MKERLILAGRLSVAILAVFLLAACPPEPEPEYTVSFDIGEGSGSAPASQKIRAGASVTLPKQGNMTAPSGKTFAGWKYGTSSTIYQAGDRVTITTVTVFTAQWGYAVSFSAGVGSGSAPASQTVTAGASVTLPGQGAMTAPSGKFFDGWKTSSGATYTTGQSVTITAATMFTAQWTSTPTYYTVSFVVGEGGGSAPESGTVTAGVSITLPGQGAMTAPSGKAFVGWKNAGSSTTYEAGTSVTIAGTTVFTAQWLNSDEIVEEGKTYVLFRNTEKFAVSIYKESTRVTEITLVPAEGRKRIESDAAPAGITFYPQFHFTVDGLPVFTQDEPAIVARIDANIVNEVTVPRLSAVTVEKACVRIDNQSSASLTLTQNGYELPPLGVGSTILLPQEQRLYVVQAGGISSYAVMRNTTEAIALPESVSEFKGGTVYTFRYNGTSLVFTSAKDMWGNWAAPPSSFTVSTAADMQAALDWIGRSTDTSAQFVIELAGSFSLGSTSISGPAVTIMSSDGEKTISLSGTGSLFTIGSGAALVLGNNVTLQGRSGNTASLVQVNSGGRLEMTAGSKITGNTADTGGGVLVYGGTFTMSGGEISDNTASNSRSGGGGVCVDSSGTFTMSGGKLSGNTASASNSLTYTHGGGGVYVYNGTFTMSGGEISGNTAGGAGVCVASSGTFMMSGGDISGNTTGGDVGGGVLVSGGTFTMSGGAISGNTASGYGGGVCVDSGTFTKQTGGVIYGSNADTSLRNTASSNTYGHTVYVYVSSTENKKRNTTAGEGVTLSSGSAGGWE